MMEVEAYHLEISLAGYFGLTQGEVQDLNDRLTVAISYLNAENQIRAFSHNYECEISTCHRDAIFSTP